MSVSIYRNWQRPWDRPVRRGLIPPVLLCVAYGTLLADRPDYLGHFAAGYGATLGAMLLMTRLAAAKSSSAVFARVVALACLVCISIGASMEATVTRIAKFDEIDFCNQSLGAVLAAFSMLLLFPTDDRRDETWLYGLVMAMTTLCLGCVHALA